MDWSILVVQVDSREQPGQPVDCRSADGLKSVCVEGSKAFDQVPLTWFEFLLEIGDSIQLGVFATGHGTVFKMNPVSAEGSRQNTSPAQDPYSYHTHVGCVGACVIVAVLSQRLLTATAGLEAESVELDSGNGRRRACGEYAKAVVDYATTWKLHLGVAHEIAKDTPAAASEQPFASGASAQPQHVGANATAYSRGPPHASVRGLEQAGPTGVTSELKSVAAASAAPPSPLLTPASAPDATSPQRPVKSSAEDSGGVFSASQSLDMQHEPAAVALSYPPSLPRASVRGLEQAGPVGVASELKSVAAASAAPPLTPASAPDATSPQRPVKSSAEGSGSVFSASQSLDMQHEPAAVTALTMPLMEAGSAVFHSVLGPPQQDNVTPAGDIGKAKQTTPVCVADWLSTLPPESTSLDDTDTIAAFA